MSHHQQNVVEKLRELGHRVTPQRQLILEMLCELGGHASIQQIYEQVHLKAPAIDRATVYRTIHLFQQHKWVVSAEINGNTVYEIAHPTPHHHLVCRSCGKIAVLDNEPFQELRELLQREFGFEVELNHLTLMGQCACCSSSAEKESPN